MQTKTVLALFCTIVVLFIKGHNGTPTSPKPTITEVKKPGAVNVRGGRTAWKTKIDSKSKKLFSDYKKVISKKLEATHKVPSKFNPKPEKTATQIVSGILYHYLIKLPSKQYAYITILDRAWKKDVYGNEDHVKVSPTLYALNDKNIKWSFT